MKEKTQLESVRTLEEIRSIMSRSVRFFSLNGWSGVWAGCVGLAGALIARSWIQDLPPVYYNTVRKMRGSYDGVVSNEVYTGATIKFLILAILVLVVAIAGGYYFTNRKAKQTGQKLWNSTSKQMILHMSIPLVMGGIFSLFFLANGHEAYIAPACLIFYGIALYNGSKYTYSDIMYLGYMEMALGVVNMFFLGYGLTFWAIGFGGLHILYGLIMWNKYDKKGAKATA